MGIATPVAGALRDVERVLLTAEEVAALVTRLAADLDREFADSEPVLVGALTGAWMLVADLARAMTRPVQVDFVSVSSYFDGAESTGRLRWEKDLSLELAGRDVVLVEDIVDTGETVARLQAALLERGPRRLFTAALLDKPARRSQPVRLDWIGAVIPDEFVVGYGLDYAQRYRQLPCVGVLRREVYGG